MSTTPSETDTLLPYPDEPTSPSQIDEPDIPILLDRYKRNVLVCKALLAIFLPATLGLEIVNLLENSRWDGESIVPGEWMADCVGTFIAGMVTISFFSILSSRITSRSERHRSFCIEGFISLIACLIIHSLPTVLYTLNTHTSPISPSRLALIFSRLRIIGVSASLITVGSMRRGPRLHYSPMQLATGFGLNAEKTQSRVGESNVVDWSNSSMLSLVFLFYISSLAQRSAQVDQLSRSDLPHMEQPVRQSGLRKVDLYNVPIPPGEMDENILKEGAPKHVTSWTLVKTVWAGRGGIITLSLILELVKTAFGYMQVIAAYEIVQTFSEPQADKGYAHLMCWGVFIGQVGDTFLGAYLAVRENYLLHLPVRMTMASLLFSKILRTADAQAMEANDVDSEESESSKGRAQVMNLLTVDINTTASLATLGPNITNGILSLTLGIGFMYTMLGVSAFVGLASIPLAMPASALVARLIYKCDRNWMTRRDARVAAIKEFLLGVKVIKLNAFEDYFKRNIERLRDDEVIWQRWRYTLGTLFNVLADQVPPVAILLTLFFHTKVLGRPLNPAAAFAALSVFNRIKDSFSLIPNTVQAIVMTRVSLGRLTAFLNQPDVEETSWDTSDLAIICEKATIGWPAADTSSFKLCLDLSLPQGKFTLVCGALGSGKTLLLRALLGEAAVISGSVRSPRSTPDATPLRSSNITGPWTINSWLDHSVAYAPQQSFIRHGTIRDNILFGQPYWPERYLETLRQASLISDLNLMEDGDLTEIGDKGVNLSGGQRARINLARCIYSRARTVYMDDILSAVDAHTSKFIVQECLAGGLLQDRTVVLVTHHVGLCLPVADFVVSLDNGRVEQACPTSEAKFDAIPLPPASPQEEEVLKVQEKLFIREKSGRQVYTEEHMATGQVDSSHYLMVFKAAGGMWYWLVLTLLYLAARGLDMAQVFYLRHWTEDTDPSHLDRNLITYSIIVFTMVSMGASRWVWLYGLGNVGFYNRGSRLIHKQLLDKICSAPLAFFESTPSGRIMNVFGQDFFRLDSSAADDFGRTVSTFLTVGTSALTVCFESPALLIVMVVFLLPLYFISRYVRKLRADLRRLTATAGSPLISLYHDTIEGVVMIRAFGSCNLLRAMMVSLINRERQAVLADYTVWNWVRGVIRFMATLIVTSCAFFLVSQNISAAQAGLMLLFITRVSGNLYNALEKYSDLDLTFVSAERVNHYVQMPVEDSESTEGIIPRPSWPEKGRIVFKELCVRYDDDLPDVLHDISLVIESGQRVGIVGATGSGKSTLALSLFRAMEARKGEIEIDGIDIKGVQLKELRRRLNMVVQDGNLGSGRLRDALDITGLKDDYEIYEALRRVHLLPRDMDSKDLETNPFANLDTFVAIEGANFSQGQRQLLCLARALLKKSKILVMDEATSSVDFEMDAKITATIKECFADTTMIVIAHRLATIMHYDRVLVLDKGRVLEYDHPQKLIADDSSAFRALCMAQGQEEFDKLLEMIM